MSVPLPLEQLAWQDVLERVREKNDFLAAALYCVLLSSLRCDKESVIVILTTPVCFANSPLEGPHRDKGAGF